MQEGCTRRVSNAKGVERGGFLCCLQDYPAAAESAGEAAAAIEGVFQVLSGGEQIEREEVEAAAAAAAGAKGDKGGGGGGPDVGAPEGRDPGRGPELPGGGGACKGH
jgi:hypothetical protein